MHVELNVAFPIMLCVLDGQIIVAWKIPLNAILIYSQLDQSWYFCTVCLYCNQISFEFIFTKSPFLTLILHCKTLPIYETKCTFRKDHLSWSFVVQTTSLPNCVLTWVKSTLAHKYLDCTSLTKCLGRWKCTIKK